MADAIPGRPCRRCRSPVSSCSPPEFPARSFETMLPASAPEACPKSCEQRRFTRADKDKDGWVEAEEIYAPRPKAFARLDSNGNGSLSFEEAADKTRGKFAGADRVRSG